MRLTERQKSLAVNEVARVGWERMTARMHNAYDWPGLPEPMKEIQRESAARLLEPIWPILEEDHP